MTPISRRPTPTLPPAGRPAALAHPPADAAPPPGQPAGDHGTGRPDDPATPDAFEIRIEPECLLEGGNDPGTPPTGEHPQAPQPLLLPPPPALAGVPAAPAAAGVLAAPVPMSLYQRFMAMPMRNRVAVAATIASGLITLSILLGEAANSRSGGRSATGGAPHTAVGAPPCPDGTPACAEVPPAMQAAVEQAFAACFPNGTEPDPATLAHAAEHLSRLGVLPPAAAGVDMAPAVAQLDCPPYNASLSSQQQLEQVHASFLDQLRQVAASAAGASPAQGVRVGVELVGAIALTLALQALGLI